VISMGFGFVLWWWRIRDLRVGGGEKIKSVP